MNYTKEKLQELRHRWATPGGKRLLRQIKKSRCYLNPALYREQAHGFPGINDEEVVNKVDLRGAPLSGYDFRVSVSGSDDGFSEEIAILSDIHFEGATLKYCNFQNGKVHDCFFENSDMTH